MKSINKEVRRKKVRIVRNVELWIINYGFWSPELAREEIVVVAPACRQASTDSAGFSHYEQSEVTASAVITTPTLPA